MDRRIESRFPVQSHATIIPIEHPEEVIEGRLINVSAGGFRLLASKNVTAGAMVVVELDSHVALAEIRYSSPEGAKFALGVLKHNSVARFMLPDGASLDEKLRLLGVPPQVGEAPIVEAHEPIAAAPDVAVADVALPDALRSGSVVPSVVPSMVPSESAPIESPNDGSLSEDSVRTDGSLPNSLFETPEPSEAVVVEAQKAAPDALHVDVTLFNAAAVESVASLANIAVQNASDEIVGGETGSASDAPVTGGGSPDSLFETPAPLEPTVVEVLQAVPEAVAFDTASVESVTIPASAAARSLSDENGDADDAPVIAGSFPNSYFQALQSPEQAHVQSLRTVPEDASYIEPTQSPVKTPSVLSGVATAEPTASASIDYKPPAVECAKPVLTLTEPEKRETADPGEPPVSTAHVPAEWHESLGRLWQQAASLVPGAIEPPTTEARSPEPDNAASPAPPAVPQVEDAPHVETVRLTDIWREKVSPEPKLAGRRQASYGWVIGAGIAAALIAAVILIDPFKLSSKLPGATPNTTSSASSVPKKTQAAAPGAAQTATSAPPTPNPATSATPVAAAASVAPAAGAGAMRHVVIVSKSSNWLSACSDTKEKVTKLLSAGDKLEFQFLKRAVVRMGNSGASEITVDGAAIGPVGPFGSPRVITINGAGFVYSPGLPADGSADCPNS